MAIKFFKGWNKDGDTFKVQDERADNLGTASTKNSTSVVTESSDLVESGAVFDALGFGNKNLLNVEEYSSKNSTVTANVDNSTGKIYLSSVGGESYAGLGYYTAFVNVSGKVKISFDLISSTVDTTKCVIGTRRISNNQFVEYLASDEFTVGHHEKEFTVSDELYLSILVNGNNKGAGYLNLEKFMISKDGGAYEPYHASVSDSLEQKADNSVIGTVEDGTNPTRSYAVNEFMVRDGAFCQVTAPVTTSSTWTIFDFRHILIHNGP